MSNPSEPSRRDLLAISAVGLLELARGSANLALSEESLLDNELLYVGTYTEGKRSDGIYVVRMNRRSGKLERVGAVNAGENPSFLAIHPNGRVLYAVNEIMKYNRKPSGAVSSLAIAS